MHLRRWEDGSVESLMIVVVKLIIPGYKNDQDKMSGSMNGQTLGPPRHRETTTPPHYCKTSIIYPHSSDIENESVHAQ